MKRAYVWEETVELLTYGVGEQEKNPMFLDKRVYQGSSGKVYPYPVIEKIEDEKKLKPYKIVILENEYIRIEVMPEIGGRVYRALDKTNGYDFVYYNQVIKPALVGLAGPWISGGIEFNWPQHHRPNTFGPVEYKFSENEDNSATVWVSEIDRMYGTKVTTAFTLYPGKAYLEISAQLYNRTSQSQTFLWWANPAVTVNEHTQSVFPPDVHAVFDHGKRDVSRFPMATGTYYKMDYSEGVDISRYKNIPVPTSYMAHKSDYDFVGGYDHGVQAGMLHVANHHISPGKKQWTWGNGEFGQAWDRHLTDEDGPYIELMTGVYTDNQPDFTWLQPYEEKTFKQYFMPYKDIGVVKNATTEAAVNLEVDELNNKAVIQAYATTEFKKAKISFEGQKRIYLNDIVHLSPNDTCKKTVSLEDGEQIHHLIVTITDSSGRILVSYQPKRSEIEQIPEAAKAMPSPEEIKTNEELYLAGLHLEQYRHATFEPDTYYLEGLKRDPRDSRIHVAYGKLLFQRGWYETSEQHFREAVKSLTGHNPNPYDGEAYYQLGLSLKHQRRLDEAFAAFYKAVWSASWQDSGYFSLAQIACEKKMYREASELVDRSLLRNAHHYQARHVKTILLRKQGKYEEAISYAKATLQLDTLDFGAEFEKYFVYKEQGLNEQATAIQEEVLRMTRGNVHNHIAIASDYASSGFYEEATEVLQLVVNKKIDQTYPIVLYALGYVSAFARQPDESSYYLKVAPQAIPDYCFPNTLFECDVLYFAIEQNPSDAKAHYYLGNLLYDKKRSADAITHWEASWEVDPNYPTVHRNLSLAYYNKKGNPALATTSLEMAFKLNSQDARVLYELDQLYKKNKVSPQDRLEKLDKYFELVQSRDDLYVEYVTLCNTLKKHDTAFKLLNERSFHPWEGGEGKVTSQYVTALVEIAKRKLQDNLYKDAVKFLQRALEYPANLGEGKLAGAQENNIYYYLGCAFEGLSEFDKAKHAFRKASQGLEEPASAMFYNDQPPEMIYYQGLAWLKLGNKKEAKRRFHKLIDYGERHLFDQVSIDYFAVSLPDFLVFDDDLKERNKIHCYYMIALGYLGLNEQEKANSILQSVLELEPNHQGALFHFKKDE
ncbi:tetratricopeptide (TPR) repeat protein [Natronobacillus azotifigens]|uniref:DUF5107 domain-containing protein n=1 Tax=Natronobacillus azotifigens TaxID=472978 RepID=A0A9J6RCT8_9BACI|nr:DUF5107 domain-containing protein [Natronobacillus azotifigens]MCZ0703166.1 DUF5107 domain-containing protein [Natronobacillus azotifigens]